MHTIIAIMYTLINLRINCTHEHRIFYLQIDDASSGSDYILQHSYGIP